MKFIGIKKLWYTEVIQTALTAQSLKTLLSGDLVKEITNTHGDTFTYTQDDPTVTEYINGITGRPYYREKTDKGARTISFTIGEYDLSTKAELQGGEASEDGKTWQDNDEMEFIEKAFIAKTKTGNYLVFTDASVIGKVDVQEKNLGLGVSAVAMDNPNEGVASEYWFDGTIVDTAQ